MNRKVLLFTLLISIPIALVIPFRFTLLWLIMGYPLGAVPSYEEVGGPTYVVLRFVSGLLAGLFYIVYGYIYGIRLYKVDTTVDWRKFVMGGGFVSLIVYGVARSVVLLYQIQSGVVQAAIQAEVARGIHPDTALGSALVGLSMDFVLRLIGSSLLGVLGGFLASLRKRS